MALNPDMNQIAIVMSQLQHNYSQLAQNWFNIFYNNNPEDVTITFFDELGNLDTFTVPNRAKDFKNIVNGQGSPEGTVSATVGTVYQDLLNGEVYLKKVGTSTTGWIKIITETELDGMIQRGIVDPNGNVSGQKGDLFVDKAKGDIYIKTTDTGNTGWKIAISSEYATHDEVETLIEQSASTKASIEFDNLTDNAEKHFINKTQISDCILEAPNDVCTVSGSTITVHEGLKLLFANGRNSDKTLKNIEFTLSNDLIYTNVNDQDKKNLVFFLIYNNGNVTVSSFIKDHVYYQEKVPFYPETNLEGMYFSKSENIWKRTISGSAWTDVIATPFLVCDANASKVLEKPRPRDIVSLAKASDLDHTGDVELIELYGTSVELQDNKAHSINITGATTFILPHVHGNTKFHQMLVLVSMPTAYSLNLGTTHYFNNSAPFMSSTGDYTLIYEWNGYDWVVGSLYKGV